jgi:hypothetical protein
MAFPMLELKFVAIVQSDYGTSFTARAYRVNDGGLDEQGHQRYARVLLRERTFSLPHRWPLNRILDEAWQRLLEWNAQTLQLPESRLICDL